MTSAGMESEAWDDRSEAERRVLVSAPFGMDASLVRGVLSQAGVEVAICRDVGEVVREIGRGAAAAVVAEEALSDTARALLTETLCAQPAWSDFPLLILASAEGPSPNVWSVLQAIGGTAEVTLLERPLGVVTFVSIVRAAVQSRQKQYRIRDELAVRREAEQSLRESEERMRFAQRAGRVGVFDWDMRSALVAWSGGMEELFGLSGGAFEGTYDAWATRVRPEDLQRLETLFSEWIRSDRPEEEWEYRFRHPDGQEHWLAARAVLIRDQDGQPLRMIGTNVDITRLKSVETRLRRLTVELEERVRERTDLLAESEAKYRGLVENTLDIPFHVSAEGKLRYVGPQVRRLGVSPEELEGRALGQLVFSADKRVTEAAFQRMIDAGEAEPLEFRVRDADGQEHWLEGRGLIHRDASGRVEGLTGVLQDVTARKMAERAQSKQREQLRKLAARMASAQDEEQRRIAQGLHDDVSQLLAACSVKLALARAADAERRQEILEEIDEILVDASDKIRSLSFELFSSTLARLGLPEALRELSDAMFRRFGVRFEVEEHGGMGGLDQATEVGLFKGARELLFNVVKHAGVLEASVFVSRDDGIIELAVEDRGVGFPDTPPEEYIDMGRGLGLFEIRERMQHLGGELRIESDPGVRTRVALRVPVRTREPS